VEHSRDEPAIHLGNLPLLPDLPSLEDMSLRCLLFTTDDAVVQPIFQVLAELEIDGEHCKSPVDAVERVTTQLFQIVITDWQDQPEAAFLLKTARDLKAAARPLTLAIVQENARPMALQAGANSVLLRPIRPEQVRDTLSTAVQLLRSKLQAASPPVTQKTAETGTMAASASVGAMPAPASLTQAPEKLRAGEFLQSPTSAPGLQFDTEGKVREELEASAAEIDAITELEPTAAAVQPVGEPEPKEPLTGWAALQARLTKSAPALPKDNGGQGGLLTYEETPSFENIAPATEAATKQATATQSETKPESESEAALFAYMEGEKKGEPALATTAPKPSKGFVVGALVLAGVALVAIPRTRKIVLASYGTALRASMRWLNPPPATLPKTISEHDSFGPADEEYKLPGNANIPEAATTDPSQIQVVPVIDPTAKTNKANGISSSQGADAGGGSTAMAQAEQPAAAAQPPSASDQNSVAPPNPQAQAPQNQTAGAPISGAQVKDMAAVNSGPATANQAAASTPAPSVAAPEPVVTSQPRQPQPAPATAPTPVATHSASASQMAGIPSSLRSQVGSTTPDMSGTKPAETAMASIGPVNLPESAVRQLLAQSVDPEYPAAAKASGQRGSVVLQVLIGLDGSVQDAKFIQGSFIFARGAIDAVKQWHFKPYSMNGQPVSVQSVITLNFQPPA
jgi:periplasmic protein TonB